MAMPMKNWAPMSCTILYPVFFFPSWSTSAKLNHEFRGSVILELCAHVVVGLLGFGIPAGDPHLIAGRCQGRALDDPGHGSEAGWLHHRQGAEIIQRGMGAIIGILSIRVCKRNYMRMIFEHVMRMYIRVCVYIYTHTFMFIYVAVGRSPHPPEKVMVPVCDLRQR